MTADSQQPMESTSEPIQENSPTPATEKTDQWRYAIIPFPPELTDKQGNMVKSFAMAMASKIQYLTERGTLKASWADDTDESNAYLRDTMKEAGKTSDPMNVAVFLAALWYLDRDLKGKRRKPAKGEYVEFETEPAGPAVQVREGSTNRHQENIQSSLSGMEQKAEAAGTATKG